MSSDHSSLGFFPTPYPDEMFYSVLCRYHVRSGNTLGYYEETIEIYDTWLRAKGFRGWNGKTWHQKLYSAILDFYGQDFLSILDAHDTCIRTWPRRLLQHQGDLVYPIYHLILMRFLAGTVRTFFQYECEKPLPFGKAPWPCRNKICGYHLKDVIEQINLRCVKGIYKATFSCPHCGMTYRRKGAIPKEMQYAGQIDIVDYGLLWKKRLKELVNQNTPITIIAKALCCDVYTVLKFGVDLGLLHQERLKQRKPYTPKGIAQNYEPGSGKSRAYHRKTWKSVVLANPDASRSDLILLENKSYEWLRKNDLEWYEKNSPSPKRAVADWSSRDDDYVELVKTVIDQIRGTPGKPVWINMNAVAKKACIRSLHGQVASGKLPKTSVYLEKHLESAVDWRKRKIIWAVRVLHGQGGKLTLNKVVLTASISREASNDLKSFILECLEML